MKVIETGISDLFVIEPKVFGDHRGWFFEPWSKASMESAGLYCDFVQDNHSFSATKGTLRGLHYQKGDTSQCKLVRCARGAVLDVAVDLRRGSPTLGKWFSVELSGENHRQLLVPKGFAHGFLTLTDDVEFLYKVDSLYSPSTEAGIRWNDPTFGVNWGSDKIENPIVSQKDAEAPLYNPNETYFVYEK